MNAQDGSDQKNLTNNGLSPNISYIDDRSPHFSPDGHKIAYESFADETSNPEGDNDIYVMNAQDGSGKKNLSNNNQDPYFDFSPDGQKIAYQTYGDETSNPEGDVEVYVMSALDGSGQKNLSNNGEHDFSPDWGGQAKTRR